MNPQFSASSSRPDLAISSDQIDLWFLFTSQVPMATELTARYRELLTEQERQQERRFYFAKDSSRYLLTRALVRTVLSRYVPLAATAWRFEPSVYGRPTITNDHELVHDLSFNISHTNELIVLAVTRDGPIGIDVEWMRREISLEVANRYFSPIEVAGLQALPAARQKRRFLDLWTLKESYIKARGMGLSIPLSKFSFDLDGDSENVISFAGDFDDLPMRWGFYQLHPSNEHLGALCTRRYAKRMPLLKSRQVVPFVSERIFDCPLSTFDKA
jgi:4'-phosphopantetheinyl transferase